MRKRLLGFLLGALFLGCTGLAADRPTVLQPNASAYSSAELNVLLPAMTRLETLLGDSDLGSRRYLAPDDWQSLNFARYTAGTLAEMGYTARLASSAGWPDGVHTWVLVGIPLPGKTAWVPVEASPAAGRSQTILGYVPKSTESTGRLVFSARHAAFTDVAELPGNLPPVAKIRLPATAVVANQEARLLAVSSYDPDGEIVLFQWSIGDKLPHASSAWSFSVRFEKPGRYAITLTAIDNGGKSATATTEIVVLGEGDQDSAPGTAGSGCGCSK